MRSLIAGPWVGEFGWELMSWQAVIRKMSKAYDRVVVCTRTGHEAIYEDFAQEFVLHSLEGTKDCGRLTGHNIGEEARLRNKLLQYHGVRMHPFKRPIAVQDQEFIKFGEGHSFSPFDVLVHARARVGKRPHHSYPIGEWDNIVKRLINAGLTVGAIGTEAYLPDGAMDLRALSLRSLMGIIRASHLVIGPSSGPIHLTSLCGTRHLVWTDTAYYSAIKGRNRRRYETIWNPLKTPCRVMDNYGWHPPFEKVVAAVFEEIRYERTDCS